MPSRTPRAPPLLQGSKVLAKKELAYVPIIGWMWYFTEMVFCTRKWEHDRKTVARGLLRLRDYPEKYFVREAPAPARPRAPRRSRPRSFLPADLATPARARALGMLSHMHIHTRAHVHAQGAPLACRCTHTHTQGACHTHAHTHTCTHTNTGCSSHTHAHACTRTHTHTPEVLPGAMSRGTLASGLPGGQLPLPGHPPSDHAQRLLWDHW